MKNKGSEAHKYLPSGEWEGFYCYNSSSAKHEMSMQLNFKNGKVLGSGTDDLNHFSFKGSYSLTAFKITMLKTYPSHTVNYQGDVDENGIWGAWSISASCKGNFHIWPKKKKSEEASKALKEEVKKLKKINA